MCYILCMGEAESKWLILIEEKEVVVGMLTDNGNLVVSEEKGWDGDDPNSLVAALDAGIGGCLANEEGLARPEKTIFVLPPFWVSHRSEVLPTRKKILEHVCKQLKLIPEGFLVGEEVLVNFYSDFVSIYFGKEYLRFTVLKDKSVEVQEELENGEDIDPEDVAVFLRQLNGKAIVPKEMIFWGRIKKGNKDRLLSHPWKEEKLFDKSPTVKIFLWPEFIEMVGQVVQGEVKLEVVKERSENKKFQPEADGPLAQKMKSEKDQVEEEKEDEKSFGFSSGDVAQQKYSVVEEKEEETPSEPVKKEPTPKIKPEVQEVPTQPKVKKKPLKERLPKIKLPKIKLGFLKSKIILILLGLPLIFAGGIYASWQFSTADVAIFITPEELSEEISVELSTEAKSLDLEGGVVPIEEVSVEKEGSKSRSTTGEKLIGEKASGEVKIFNRTAERVEFEGGTTLIGPEDLEFVLDNDVSIASKTADLDTGVDRWGETTAEVTAGGIGAEYNLAAESTFTVSDFSDDEYLARNTEAFSGGTSREIRAVSEEDLQNLRDNLTEELTSEAEKELNEKLADSQVIDGSFSPSAAEEEFSAEVGDEVDTISLDLTVEVTAARISQERLIQIAEQVLAEKVESGYELREGSLKAKLDIDEESEDENITGKLTLKGEAYPEIDQADLGQKLTGKKESKAKELIRESYPRIYRYEVNYQFFWLKYVSYLPPRPENIIIEVEE